MSTEKIDIPNVRISATLTEAVIDGGESSVLVEIPESYTFQWRVDFGTDPAKAQMRIFGEVTVTRAEIEAQNAAKPLALMVQEKLAKNTRGLVKQKIAAQIQELFRKDPAP